MLNRKNKLNITQEQPDWVLGHICVKQKEGQSVGEFLYQPQCKDIDIIKNVLNKCVNSIPEEGLVLRLDTPIENIIMPSLYITLIPPSNSYKNPRISINPSGVNEFCISLNMDELKQLRANINKMIKHLESKNA